MDNRDYADRLDEIAALLQVAGENAFRVRAFENAARAIRNLDADVDALLDAGTITDVPGIGKSIAADLRQLRANGSCVVLDELRSSLPPGLLDMLRVQGLGPKKVQRLWHELGISDLPTLESAARDGRIAALSGFGKKSEEKILSELRRLQQSAGRTPIARAWPVAMRILERLRKLPQVRRAEAAGSLRRGRDTVGDLDFVVASDDPEPIMAAFVALPDVEEVIAHGPTKSSVHLAAGLSADLRVVPPEVFGATLHHFTGSKDHNILVRARAQRLGLRVSEWGVFRDDTDPPERIACATEADIFAAVGLPFIPPELREGTHELTLAEADRLPALVALDDIRADLHMHTQWSDGRHTIREMRDAAAARGCTHIAITDHSRALTVARGLTRDRLLAQLDEIDALNDEGHPVRVLRGLEADILEHGEIDMDTDVLERLDWVVGSVHSRMNQPPDVMTERLVAAVRSGLISAIGHPTGRLIGTRDPYAFDLDAVLDACEALGVALEINAAPERLDLADAHIRRVLERPALWLTVNTDAHATAELDQMHFGVRMARRGGAPAARVLNTLPLDAFLANRRAPRAAR